MKRLHPFDLFRSRILRGMYTLDTDRRVQVIAALVEGNSIRSVERMTGIHRDTIMRLTVRVGTGCAALMDREMRNLNCQRLQLDELWAFVGMKQKRASQLAERGEFGDAYTFVALDADTKASALLPCRPSHLERHAAFHQRPTSANH